MFIKGVGCTNFGVEQSSQKLVYEAVNEALNDADIGIANIDVILISSMTLASNGERQRHISAMLSSLFQRKLPIINITAACAGGGAALWSAIQLSYNPNYNNILVVGVEKILANINEIIIDELMMGADYVYEQLEGLNFPAQNALIAQQHMLKHGTTEEDFALVAYKNHKNGFLNPKARFYKKEVTLEQIRSSPIVASPLRLYDCCISANGSAAVVLSKDKSDIEIAGSGFCVDRLPAFESDDMTSWQATRLAAEQAYKQTGITARDIDIAEVHDCFTPIEIISYEDLGFAKAGEGAELIRSNTTALDGNLPVNTSGGLKAKGHPISATGISQIYELTKQLRGEAGDRQVNGTYALAQNIGGAGSTASVHILKKAKYA